MVKTVQLTSKSTCSTKVKYYQLQHADSMLGSLKKRKKTKELFKNGYVYECNECTWYHISKGKGNEKL